MTTQTLTITNFLLARITEDEVAARAVHEVTVKHYPRWVNGEQVTPRDPSGPFLPSRVLAECAWKRRIVALHQVTWRSRACAHCGGADSDRLGCAPGDSGHWECSAGDPVEQSGCSTLTLMTAAYADHPDYREEWR